MLPSGKDIAIVPGGLVFREIKCCHILASLGGDWLINHFLWLSKAVLL